MQIWQVMILVFALIGCEDSDDEFVPSSSSSAPAKARRRKKKTVEKKQVRGVIDEIARNNRPYYNPLGKLDPFEETSDKKPEGYDPLLTDYDLATFELLGVVWGENHISAMLLGPPPRSKGFIVKRGMRIGTGNGHILRIEKKQIVVRESIMGGDDKEYFIDHAIKMAHVKLR